MTTPDEPMAVKIDHACKLLDVGRATVMRLIDAGRLRTITIGAQRGRRITMASIRALVAEAEPGVERGRRR